MKLLILSDTHGNYPLAIRALELAGRIDQVFHLGDGIDDARIIEEITGHNIIKVPGNCDLTATEPREVLTVLAGKTIFATHGDSYNVKAGLGLLHKKACQENAGIVLYGHTHVGYTGELDGILYVNPGCLRYKWPVTSYAIISIDAGRASAGIFPIHA
jgi:putative phosphoesterase